MKYGVTSGRESNQSLKTDFQKEAEQEVLLAGLERLVTKILGQNVENMNTYNENMTLQERNKSGKEEQRNQQAIVSR